MGRIVKITCASCGTEWERMIGCGISHADLVRIAELYPPEQCREIRSFAEQTENPLFDFGYRLSRCLYCNSIERVPVLEMEESGETYIGMCPQCMQETELIEELDQTECPVCHQQELHQEETGLWD